jgi:UDP-GlcNAc:undecaprenyl-phosphate GlcNAc-1-phosphate transferase
MSEAGQMGLRALLAGAGALAAGLLLTPLVRAVMSRLGVMDLPGGRHGHAQATPRGGGLAIVAALWFGFWLSGSSFSGPVAGLLAGLALLVPLCLLDDIFGLPPRPRLLGQILAASLAWRLGVRVEGVTNLLAPWFGEHWLALGWISWPVTVAWLVALTNAVNWMDGVDGLAGGVSAMASAALAFMGYLSGMSEVACLAAAVAGAALGFLRYNFAPASVFMGDVGAMSLGFTIACVSAVGAFKSAAVAAFAAPLLVGAVPLYDVATTVWGRWRRGQAIDAPDRSHVHHRLLDRGYTPVQTVLVLYAATAAFCLAAIAIWRMDS